MSKPSALLPDFTEAKAIADAALRDGVPADRLRTLLVPVLQQMWDALQEAQKATYMASDDVLVLLRMRTRSSDLFIQFLYETACRWHYPNVLMPPFVLAATGGYGRRELFPGSDIDLLCLYAGRTPDEHIGEALSFILYLLWDIGLTVGHATRSIAESVALAKEDITIQTSLLESRYLCGDKKLWRQFSETFRKQAVKGQEAQFIRAKLAERNDRLSKHGDARYMLEPHIKNGRGGLRDLHMLFWFARCCYQARRLRDLVTSGFLEPDEYRIYIRARRFLWQVRAHLHYLTGRNDDRLTLDIQPQLARVMGYHDESSVQAVERFMKRFFQMAKRASYLANVFCALLESEYRQAFSLPFQLPGLRRRVLAPFTLQDNRLAVADAQIFQQQPEAMLNLFLVAAQQGLDIHPRSLRLLARHLHRIDGTLRKQPEANALFLEILLETSKPGQTLRRMAEAGVLGKFLPDFGRVVGQMQFNMYHVYTVDEHTIHAVSILNDIEQGHLQGELPLATSLLPRVQSRRALYLAVFLHDIAKGRPGDHSVEGEKVARRWGKRFQLSPLETDTIAWLVRHHLLFSNTAFKRDLNDPKSISDFVEEVQSIERLRLLLILTAADIRAVGPNTWNGWKGALLRDLYARAEDSLLGKQASGDVYREQLQLGLQQEWPEAGAKLVDAYLSIGNPNYWQVFNAPTHARLARLMAARSEWPQPFALDIETDRFRSFTQVIFCAPDRHGLFSRFTAAATLSGANIVGGKVFTLENGLAVEMLQLQDHKRAAFDDAHALQRLQVFLGKLMADSLTAREALKPRARLNRRSRVFDNTPQLLIDNEASNSHTVLEISARDMPGLLCCITTTLQDEQLSIRSAQVATFGERAVDVFYVKNRYGMKIHDRRKQTLLREALLKNIQALQGEC